MAKKAKGSGGGRKAAHKGSGYERYCAKELSLWLTNDSTEDAVWRSAASGAKATMQSKGGDGPTVHVGDLILVMPEANAFFAAYAAECKRVKVLQWRAMFNTDLKCNIREFWNQVSDMHRRAVPTLRLHGGLCAGRRRTPDGVLGGVIGEP